MKYITHLKAVFLMLTVSLFIAGCGEESSTTTSSDLTSSGPTTRTLTFNSNTLSLEVGAGGTLIASLTTGTGTVMYASDNTGVATIDRLNGAVTAISAGTAIITANVLADGSLFTAASATATVTVTSPTPTTPTTTTPTVTTPTVTLSSDNLRLGVGESASVVVTLDGSTDTAATVVSGGASIATAVNNNGIITIEGAAPGQTDVVVTASDNSTAAVTVVVNNRPTGNTGYHAFVTGYAVSTTDSIFAHTDNGFDVYAFQGNGFANAFNANNEVNINQRLGVGAQFFHDSTLSNTAFAGISVQAPQSYDFSSATHLVLQIGNALPASAHPNAHSTFTARIQNSAGQQCNINVPLSPSDTPNTGSQGLLTHTLDLSTGWDCGDSRNISDVLPTLDEVAVLLLGGTDPDSDASTNSNHTLMILGNIGFLGTRAATPNTNDLQLLAHSYATGRTIPDGDIGSDAITNANAGVYLFQSDGITTSWDGARTDANVIQQRQSVGNQWTSTGDLTEGMSFGLTVQAPNRGRLAVSSDSALQIQMGSGAADDAKTHTTFTVRVTGGIQHPSNFSWQHDCQVNVSVAEARVDPPTAHEFRHGHYTIPLADFSTCRSGSLEGIVDAGVSEVIVSVEGGNNPVADVGGGFHTLIQIGWIGFTR